MFILSEAARSKALCVSNALASFQDEQMFQIRDYVFKCPKSGLSKRREREGREGGGGGGGGGNLHR